VSNRQQTNEIEPANTHLGWLSIGSIVVLGLLLILGWKSTVSNMERARNQPRTQCVANLKQIEGAVLQWALDNKKGPGDIGTFTNPVLLVHLKGSVFPNCPLGGTYSQGPAAAYSPLCTIPGHTL
jgi:hypothetical protein